MLDLARIAVRDGQPADGPVVGEHVNRGPVGQPRHREPRDAGQASIVVERGLDELRGEIGQERAPLFLAALAGDVAEDQHHAGESAVRVADGRGAVVDRQGGPVAS